MSRWVRSSLYTPENRHLLAFFDLLLLAGIVAVLGLGFCQLFP